MRECVAHSRIHIIGLGYNGNSPGATLTIQYEHCRLSPNYAMEINVLAISWKCVSKGTTYN